MKITVPGTVHIAVTPGAGPGQLSAVLSFVGDDGTIFDLSPAVTLSPGMTLSYSGLSVEVEADTSFIHVVTPAGVPTTSPLRAIPAAPSANGAPGRPK